MLDLADNQLGGWGTVRQVGALPSLTALNVSSNLLPDLQEPLNQGVLPDLALLSPITLCDFGPLVPINFPHRSV